jgi:hypothetical protein
VTAAKRQPWEAAVHDLQSISVPTGRDLALLTHEEARRLHDSLGRALGAARGEAEPAHLIYVGDDERPCLELVPLGSREKAIEIAQRAARVRCEPTRLYEAQLVWSGHGAAEATKGATTT